jgi:hypothetical protein
MRGVVQLVIALGSSEEEELMMSQRNLLIQSSGCKSRLIKVEQTDQ